MIDHVTYQVYKTILHEGPLTEFLQRLELVEVEPDKRLEGDWDVRWFRSAWDGAEEGAVLHLVAAEKNTELGLAHFAVMVSDQAYRDWIHGHFPGANIWLERYSGGEKAGHVERCWARGPGGIRVEIRPNGMSSEEIKNG